MVKILLHKKDHGLDISHRQEKKSEAFINVKNFTAQKRPYLGLFSLTRKKSEVCLNIKNFTAQKRPCLLHYL